MSEETRVTDPNTGGQKGRKLERYDLIPQDAIEWLARLYGKGAEKYAERNWEKGYSWALSYAALQRHLKWWWHDREWLDSETGCPHLAAVIWHGCALLVFALRRIGTDDRPPAPPTLAPEQSRKPLVYVAHPLGSGDDRQKNRARAARWVAWAATQNVIPVAPWVTVAEVWDESKRDAGMALDLETIEQCDEVWLVGGRVSPGMAIEAAHARKLGKTVKELFSSPYGEEPPNG